MLKIGMCVRNRLEITKKSIEALHRHTSSPFQLYVYDNLTNYRLKDHFNYYHQLLEDKKITQITFNTEQSTHNAFSKASSLNQFGHNHQQEPDIKGKYKFLVFIDNDMLVVPQWDLIIEKGWDYVAKHKMNDVKIIGQYQGMGIKSGGKPNQMVGKKIAGGEAYFGKLGGSGFWTVRNDFFIEVGFLDLKSLVNITKKHDQIYWTKLDKLTNGRGYILGLKQRLVLNTGGSVGSVCNAIGYKKATKEELEKIKFKKADAKVGNMSFDEFYKQMWDSGC